MVTYCRKRKDLIKRAMELSMMCSSDVLVVISEPKKKKMTYYSSTPSFNLMSAHKTTLEARSPKNVHEYERFTNADYDNLCTLDFRTIRYKKEEVYLEKEDGSEDIDFVLNS